MFSKIRDVLKNILHSARYFISAISFSVKNALIVLISPAIESNGEMYLNSATITCGAPYTALEG